MINHPLVEELKEHLDIDVCLHSRTLDIKPFKARGFHGSE
jgi:hypothetical protein